MTQKIAQQKNEASEAINDKKSKKTRFILDVIKIVIWLIFLYFSYIYLMDHPAEKTAMSSGFQVMYQKVDIFIRWFFSGETKYYEDKANLLKSYQELNNSYQSSNCWLDTEKWVVAQKYVELQNLDIKTYKLKQMEYYDFLYEYNSRLLDKCWTN